MKTTEVNEFRFRLLLVVCVFLFLFKLFMSSNYVAILFNSLLEFSIFYLIYVGFLYVKESNLSTVIYYFIFYFNFFMFSLTNYYFNDALSMKYSFYNLSIGEVGFFVDSLMQFSFFIGVVFFGFGCYYLATIEWKKINLRTLPLFVGCLLIFISSQFIYYPVNNVYATTTYEVLDDFFKTYIDVERREVSSSSFTHPFLPYESYNLSNKRVLFFVMEQTSYDDFVGEVNSLDDNFFSKINSSTHWYSNYYTTNQDSRTSIWTMFSSQFIPFESYTSNWNKEYGFILEEPNLIELFNYHNYTTTVAASMYEPSLILGAYNWDETIFLKKYPMSGSICVHEFDYQKGCEDKAILDEVIEQSYDSPQFLFQEMIFGHGEAYLDKSNLSKIEYYNEYFNSVYESLRVSGELNDTMIVIVSDHGNKGYYHKEISDYQIPLLIYDQSLEHKEIDDMYSHLVFKDILLSYLDSSIVSPLDEVFIVGQTQSNELAYINSNGSFFTGMFDPNKGFWIGENTLDLNSIRFEMGEFLTYRDDVSNKSSSKLFYCKLCYNNSLKIQEKRE